MAIRSNWSRAENVLCVRLDALGDVLMTTPALRAIKESRPGARVTLLTSPSGAAAARLVPEIDDVVVYEAPWIKATAPHTNSATDGARVAELKRRGFDAAIIFTVYSQNPLPAAMLCYLADIPLRLAHCRENPYQLLTDWVVEHEPEAYLRHEVRRQLDLVEQVGYKTGDDRMSLRVLEDARVRVRQRLADLGVDTSRPWVVIHPGATAPSRRYSQEGFARVARRLALEEGYQVVFTGSAAERQVVEDIQTRSGAQTWSLVDCLDLGEFAALLSLAPLLISNNTGPVHVAAAVGTPVVDLYALTNPQHTPWRVPNRVLFHDVPCKYCYKSVCPQGHHNCLRLVTSDQIVDAVRDLLRANARVTAQPAEATPSVLPVAEVAVT